MQSRRGGKIKACHKVNPRAVREQGGAHHKEGGKQGLEFGEKEKNQQPMAQSKEVSRVCKATAGRQEEKGQRR